MNLSERLMHIIDFIPQSTCLADIGTDHGFIPIYAILNSITEYAIASDINPGPVKVAKKNITKHGLSDKIQTRIGPGLSTLKASEAETIVIAGMGGILIADIIEENIKIARSASTLILQPVQYPEVLRKYLLTSNFNIIDEDIVKDENKYYYIIKAISEPAKEYEKDAYYYTGKKLVEKGNPLLKEYLNYKISSIKSILDNLSPIDQNIRHSELTNLKTEFEEILYSLK